MPQAVLDLLMYELEVPEAFGIGLAALLVGYVVHSFFTVPGGYGLLGRSRAARRRAYEDEPLWRAYLESQRSASARRLGGDDDHGPFTDGDGDGGDCGGGE